ncbi:MAG: DUF4157 domain-containing protein [Bacteroidota bacterium]
MKFRKSRKTKGGSGTLQKKREPFLHSKEGNENGFLRPQARALAGENSLPEALQTKMEGGLGEDFSSVKIHSQSSDALEMGAMAYTNGENVHFAPGMYDPTTTAGQELIGHELTHVKQQRQGRVQPGIQAKGLSLNNDRSLEAEADQLGKKAATSETASSGFAMRRSPSGTAASSKGVVQMKPYTDYGEFKTKTYIDDSTDGVEMGLEFHPNKKVDATKIGLIQTVNSQLDGKNMLISPTRANRQTASGTRIDRVDDKNNPVYGSKPLKSNQGLSSTPNKYGNYKLGFRKKDSSGKWIDKPAYLYDHPTLPGHGNNSHQKFETAALALSGTQKDMYYGSVKWGWEMNGKGVFKRLPVALLSKGDMPTSGFRDAAKKWNDTKVIGTLKTTGDPTKVYDVTFKLIKGTTIKKDTIVKLGNTFIDSGDTYSEVSDSKGKSLGIVKVRDLVDIGDGAKTIDLPIPWKGTVKTTYMATLRQGKSKESATLADLPNGIKLTVINDKSGWLKVHLDPTQKGLVVNTLGKKSIDAANLLRGYISKELVKR